MVKVSDYNILVKELNAGEQLVYNSYSSCLGILEKNNKDMLNDVDILDVNKLDMEGKQCLKVLIENGYLLNSDEDELREFRKKHYAIRTDKKALNLTIAPTLLCNMCCPYCYEGGLEEKKNKMNQKTIERLITFVEEKIRDDEIKEMNVCWYGGEPLLEFKTIVYLSEKFISLSKKYNFNYNANIVTNGTLLNYEKASILTQKCGVTQAQITIDGLERTQNERRKLKNGENSFETIEKNIDLCCNLMGITIRINVDKYNIDEIEDLVEFFEGKSSWNNNVSYYFSKVEDQANVSIYNQCLSVNEYCKFQVNILKRLSKKRYKSFFINTFPSVRYCFCSAILNNNYVIDPNGDFYTCLFLIGNKDRRIGSLYEEGYKEEFDKWINYEYMDKCNCCKLLPICSGGCPQKVIDSKSINEDCEKNIDVFKTYLEEYYNIINN